MNILPQLLKELALRSQSAPISMYLRMLLGRGGTMTQLPSDLQKSLRNTNLEDPYNTLSEIRLAGIEDPSPFDISSYNMGDPTGTIDRGLHLRDMANPWKYLMLKRTLGNFRAEPVGQDSVRISDRYDFEDDPAGFSGSERSTTAPFVMLAQLAGHPYSIRSTISAPRLNAQLRERERVFQQAKEFDRKERLALLKALGK